MPFFLPPTEPGATLRVYDAAAELRELPVLVAGRTPNVDRIVPRLDLASGDFSPLQDRFYAEITAELDADGLDAVRLTCDDGATVEIGGRLVVADDGVHAPRAKEAAYAGPGGWTPIKVRFFDNDQGELLRVEGRFRGEWRVLGSDRLRVPAGLTRVVSPGPKRFLGIGAGVRPGDGAPLDRLNPAWSLVPIRPPEWRPQVGAMGFAGKTLLVATFAPNQSGTFEPDLRDGVLWAVDGPGSPPRRIAEGLQEPLGMVVRGRDVLVSQRDRVERFRLGPDETVLARDTVASGWTSDNYHHFTFGLAEGRDGWVYGALSTSIRFEYRGINGPNPPFRGSAFRFRPDAYDPKRPLANLEWLTSGHRTPNGIVALADGSVLVGENQGAWQPANKLNEITPGGFYGHANFVGDGGVPGVFQDRPFVPPAVYLPQNECANSPAQPVQIPSGPFRGQLYVTDVKYGGLTRVFLERIGGRLQGGAVHASQGFECGWNRAVWGPEGDLYLGGIGATESWAWTDPANGRPTQWGLQRVLNATRASFEIRRVTATRDGFRVELTEPARAVGAVIARQWRYEPTPDYGGDKVDRETLAPRAALSADGRTVTLTVPGLRAGRVVWLDLAGVRSRSGAALLSSECWYTLNRIPGRPAPWRVLVYSRTTGFRHDSIPAAIAALRREGEARGFEVDAAEDPALFTPENLRRYGCVVFALTTGDVLTPAGRDALRAYVEGGGGWVGIHSAIDTEYGWPFYGSSLSGAWFRSHPPGTSAADVETVGTHPTTTGLPRPWRWTDEWYEYLAPPSGMDLLLRGGGIGPSHPLAWSRGVGRGRAWTTALGHPPEAYADPTFTGLLGRAVVWARGG